MSQAVVIGGGVIGLCAAYELLERGFKVNVLDPGPQGGFFAASHENGGMIVPSHFVPLAAPGMMKMGLNMLPNPKGPFGFALPPSAELVKWSAVFARSCTQSHVDRCAPTLKEMHTQSKELYLEYAKKARGSFSITQNGLIMLCAKKEALHDEEELAKRGERLGLRAELQLPEALRREEPNITIKGTGGVKFLDDAHLDPADFMAWIHGELEIRGATFTRGVALGFRDERGKIVSVATSVGAIQGDVFVLAAGAWTGELAKSMGLRIPMMAGKGYGFTIAHPRETLSACAILTEARVAVTPMARGLHFVGTMEIGAPNQKINWKRVEGIVESIPKYFPSFTGLKVVDVAEGSLDIPKRDVWVGLRPLTPDGMPVLGRPDAYANLIVASGHGMMGMSLGPITGKLVAQLAAEEKTSLVLSLMTPDRFA